MSASLSIDGSPRYWRDLTPEGRIEYMGLGPELFDLYEEMLADPELAATFREEVCGGDEGLIEYDRAITAELRRVRAGGVLDPYPGWGAWA